MENNGYLPYLIENNQHGAVKVLYKYGYLSPLNAKEVYDAVYLLAKEQGQPGIEDLLRQHPDWEVITGLYLKDNPQPEKIVTVTEKVTEYVAAPLLQATTVNGPSQIKPQAVNILPTKTAQYNPFGDTIKDILIAFAVSYLMYKILKVKHE